MNSMTSLLFTGKLYEQMMATVTGRITTYYVTLKVGSSSSNCGDNGPASTHHSDRHYISVHLCEMGSRQNIRLTAKRINT